MSINPSRMIPLHVADAAVAACEAEIQKLREEVERLRASSFVTAVPSADYEKLKAENEQIKHKLGRLLGGEQEWVLVEPSEYNRLKAENERLRKAGDAMAIDCARWCMSDQGALGLTLETTLENLPSVIAWNAAKQPPTDPTK